jgi:hypothetical protein
MELRDTQDRVIFHRLLEDPVASSVEVHSPDGKIRREFGPLPETMFEVLVPDDADARSLVLMGEYLDPASAREVREGGARELIRFDVPTGERGGQAERSGGGDGLVMDMLELKIVGNAALADGTLSSSTTGYETRSWPVPPMLKIF